MRSLLLLTVATVLSGCLSSRKFEPVHSYDMQTRFSAAQPGSAASSSDKAATRGDTVPVVAQFRMLGPADARMLFRTSAHRLEYDEYHRWAQPPEKYIGREFHIALRRRFGGRERLTKGEALLYGDILAMEGTLARSAHLALELRLVDETRGLVLLSKLYERVEAVKKPGPEAFVDAMAAALESIIDEVLDDVAEALSRH